MKSYQNHLVSVIIPTFNRWPLVADAIDSVLHQTYQNIEIIVVDDGSTDMTQTYVKRIYPKIKYFYKKNQGVSIARNSGIEIAKGQLIAFLDSDDYWHPEKLERQVAFFGSPVVAAVGCFANLIDGSGKQVGVWNGSFSLQDLVIRNRLPGGVSGIIIRRDSIVGNRWFDESLHFGEDWKLWLKLIKDNSTIEVVPETLVTIRIHNAQKEHKNPVIFYSDVRKVIDWFDYENPAQRKKALAYLHLDCARLCATEGKRLKVMKHLFRSFIIYLFKIVPDDNRFYLLAEVLGLKKVVSGSIT